MEHQDQLKQARLELAEIERQIQEQTQTDEAWAHAEQTERTIREQLLREDGAFRSQSVLDALLVTRIELEEQIFSLMDAIEKQSVPVEVKGSARKEALPLEPPALMQTGFFSSLGNWFKKALLGKGKPGAPAPKNRLSARQRENVLKNADLRQKRWTADLQSHNEYAYARERPDQPAHTTSTPVSAQSLYDSFLASGWHKYDTPLSKDAPQSVVKSQLAAFLRELGNAKFGVTDQSLTEDYAFVTDEFSLESVTTLLNDRSDESVRTFLQPLLQFDHQAFLARYPLQNAKTPEEKVRISDAARTEAHTLLSMIQWADKFAKRDVMSPQLEEEFTRKVTVFNLVSTWAMSGGDPVMLSVKQSYEQDILRIDDLIELGEHRTEINQLRERGNQSLPKAPPIMQKDLSALGFSSSYVRYLARSGGGATDQTVYLPVKQLEELRDGNPEEHRRVMQELEQFSLITREGRTRLCGTERAPDVLRYGEEDLAYYARMSEAGALFLNYCTDKNDPLHLTREQRQALTLNAEQATALYHTINHWMEDTSTSYSLVGNQRDSQLPPLWFQRREHRELTAFEEREKQEKKQRQLAAKEEKKQLAAQRKEQEKLRKEQEKQRKAQPRPVTPPPPMPQEDVDLQRVIQESLETERLRQEKVAREEDSLQQVLERSQTQTHGISSEDVDLQRVIQESLETERLRQEKVSSQTQQQQQRVVDPGVYQAPKRQVEATLGGFQTSGNGCWSVAYSALLGHHGVRISQESIRARRYTAPTGAHGNQLRDLNALNDRVSHDRMNEIIDHADLMAEQLPGYAMLETNMDTQKVSAEQILQEIVTGLEDDSPVAILYQGHYRTIVGIEGRTISYKNSLSHSPQYGPEHIYTMDVSALLQVGQLQLTWLKHLAPNEDGTLVTEDPGLSYINGQLFDLREPEPEGQYFHARGKLSEDSSQVIDTGIDRVRYYPNTLPDA